MRRNPQLLLVVMIAGSAWSQLQVVIEAASPDSLTQDEYVPRGGLLPQANPLARYHMTSFDTAFYAYAVIRDWAGNFLRMADSADWISLDTNRLSILTTPQKRFECFVVRTRAFGSDDASIVVSEPIAGIASDTLTVTVNTDGCLVRLFNVDAGAAVDTLRCIVGDSVKLQAQGTPHDFPESWRGWAATWSVVSDSLQLLRPVPAAKDSLWTFAPTTSGTGTLLISLGGYMSRSIRIIAVDASSAVGDGSPARQVSSPMMSPKATAGAKHGRAFTLDGRMMGSALSARNDHAIGTGSAACVIETRSHERACLFECRLGSLEPSTGAGSR